MESRSGGNPGGRVCQHKLGVATSLQGKIFTGAGWILGWRMATRGLGLVSTLVLVRLLLPEDFGLIALAVGYPGGRVVVVPRG